MKILMGFHTLAYPPQSGVRRRTFHLLDETAKCNDVTIVSLGTRSDEASVREYFRDTNVRIIFVDYGAPKWINLLKRIKMWMLQKSLLQISVTREMQRTLDRIFRKEKFDLIFLSSPVLLYYKLPNSIPCVADTHNVEYDLWYRSYQHAKSFPSRIYLRNQYKLMKRDELELCRQPDILLATSERDKELFEQDLHEQTIRVIPNGVDISYFVPQEVQEIPHSMVFSGVMNYLPNENAMMYFLDKIFPLIQKSVPDTKIFIVGTSPSKKLKDRSNEHITVTGQVEDVRPYIAKAEVYVIPLLIGGGTRLKALEASAMKKAIVSTSLGCEGINFRDGESVLLADTPEAFSQAVIRLFDDRVYRVRLAEQAYSTVASSYSWRAIGGRLNDVLKSAVQPKKGTMTYDDVL